MHKRLLLTWLAGFLWPWFYPKNGVLILACVAAAAACLAAGWSWIIQRKKFWPPTLLAGGGRILLLFPFILLTLIAARCDPHLFRYWDLKSWRQWSRGRLTWRAYAIGLAGWAVLLGGLHFLMRWLSGNF